MPFWHHQHHHHHRHHSNILRRSQLNRLIIPNICSMNWITDYMASMELFPFFHSFNSQSIVWLRLKHLIIGQRLRFLTGQLFFQVFDFEIGKIHEIRFLFHFDPNQLKTSDCSIRFSYGYCVHKKENILIAKVFASTCCARKCGSEFERHIHSILWLIIIFWNMVFSLWAAHRISDGARHKSTEMEGELEYLQKVSQKNSNKAGTKIVVQETQSFAGTKFFIYEFMVLFYLPLTHSHSFASSLSLSPCLGKLCKQRKQITDKWWQIYGRIRTSHIVDSYLHAYKVR